MFEILPRQRELKYFFILSPLYALLLSIVCMATLLYFLEKDPWLSIQAFFLDPFSSPYLIGEIFLKMTPLMILSTGLAYGFKAGVWNIGSEGQYILGAIFASGAVLYFPNLPSYILLPAMAISGIVGGILWALIPALLKITLQINEVLVSLMLVYVSIFLCSWLLYNTWQDPMAYGFPQTIIFPDSAFLPRPFAGLRFDWSFFIGLGFLVVSYFVFTKSYFGYQLSVLGQSPKAALFAGFSEKKLVLSAFLISGGAAGFAGMAEVSGPSLQLTTNVSHLYGFSAIIVAFLGRLHPLGTFLASFLMALIFMGAERLQQTVNLPRSMGMVFQGLLLLFLLGCDFFLYYKIRLKKRLSPS